MKNMILLLTILTTFSCSFDQQKESTKVTIKTPSKEYLQSLSSGYESQVANSALGEISSWADVNCFGVIVESPEKEARAKCFDSDGATELSKPFAVFDLVPAGEELVIDLETGPQRNLQLVAVKSLMGCYGLKEYVDGIGAPFSKPRIVGQKIIDLVPGDMEEEILADLSTSLEVGHCEKIEGSNNSSSLVFNVSLENDQLIIKGEFSDVTRVELDGDELEILSQNSTELIVGALTNKFLTLGAFANLSIESANAQGQATFFVDLYDYSVPLEAIDTGGASSGDVLTFNGSFWAPAPSSSLGLGSVGTAEIANLTIQEEDIADESITLVKLAENSVDSSKIVDGSIQGADLAHNYMYYDASNASIGGLFSLGDDLSVVGNSSFTGDVSIGGAPLSFPFNVHGTGSVAALFKADSGGSPAGIQIKNTTSGRAGWKIGELGDGSFGIENREGAPETHFFINQDGNVGIGTGVPLDKFEVEADPGSGRVARFKADHSAGEVGITIENLQATGNGWFIAQDDSGFLSIKDPADTAMMTFFPGGAVNIPGTFTNSDERFKKNITPLNDSLSRVLRLSGMSFFWRHDEFKKFRNMKERDIGVIAQDIEKEFPEVVSTDSDGYKSVAYSKLVSPIIEAIKDFFNLFTENKEDHEKRISELEAQNEALRESLCGLKPDLKVCK